MLPVVTVPMLFVSVWELSSYTEGIKFFFIEVADDIYMSEVAHVCTKKDFQFIGKSVATVLYLSHLAEEYSCGEDEA